MTTKQIQKFTKECIDLFQLNNWRVIIELIDERYMIGTCDKVAECAYSFESMSATILVCTKQTDEEIKLSIIHELLHLCLAEITGLVDGATNGKSEDFRELMKTMIYQKAEECVIRLERVLGHSI